MSTLPNAQALGRLLAGAAAAAPACHMHTAQRHCHLSAGNPQHILTDGRGSRLAGQAASGANSAARPCRPAPAFPNT